MYDKNNVFAKIVRNEIPRNAIVENEYALSFNDINPLFEKHVLVIPKGEYENILEFTSKATADEQAGFWACFRETAEKLGINQNFNVLANAGADAPFVKQSVFHFHLHLVSGSKKPELNKVLEEICG